MVTTRAELELTLIDGSHHNVALGVDSNRDSRLEPSQIIVTKGVSQDHDGFGRNELSADLPKIAHSCEVRQDGGC